MTCFCEIHSLEQIVNMNQDSRHFVFVSIWTALKSAKIFQPSLFSDTLRVTHKCLVCKEFGLDS